MGSPVGGQCVVQGEKERRRDKEPQGCEGRRDTGGMGDGGEGGVTGEGGKGGVHERKTAFTTEHRNA